MKNIPISEYKKLASYLFAIQEFLGDSVEEIVDECARIMIDTIRKLDSKTINLIVFDICAIELKTKKIEEKLYNFINEIDKMIISSKKDFFDYDYSVEKLGLFYQYISENHDYFVEKRYFATKIDVEKMLVLLTECSSENIYKIRKIFYTVYAFSNIKDFFANDKEALEELRDEVDKIIARPPETFDRIQIIQLNYFYDDLLNFIDRL